ncbi:TlpA disulfide reductase family protein [Megasphaera paucivorans]|uniref:Thiol-disulfide isomerase or thioredoxin n=1 Tax=Megasphaera paucivorans TaxID=349095 RepID=A0A1G9XRH0_9FIRM|nr:TlpA disulfide reductase family protein [Megasphaera paucivorans]SDM99111.1 Thiol-disulfide isomerase or thioredoxin [Megasphaera paucivorans]
MKKIIVFCIAVMLSTSIMGCAAQESSPKEGNNSQHQTAVNTKADEKAPNLQLKTLDGKKTSVKQLYQDKPVYLNFWASWCPPCVQEMPHIEHLQKEYGSKLHFVAVTVDENPSDAAYFIKKNSITMPVYTGDLKAITQQYGVSAIPVSIIIDTNGKIIAKRVGGMDEQELKEFLAPVLNK